MFSTPPMDPAQQNERRKRLMQQMAGRTAQGGSANTSFLRRNPSPNVTQLRNNLPPGLANLLGPGGYGVPGMYDASPGYGAPVNQQPRPGPSFGPPGNRVPSPGFPQGGGVGQPAQQQSFPDGQPMYEPQYPTSYPSQPGQPELPFHDYIDPYAPPPNVYGYDLSHLGL